MYSLSYSSLPLQSPCQLFRLFQTINIPYTITRLLDHDTSLKFTDYKSYPDELKSELETWNASWGTQLPWRTLQNNVSNRQCLVILLNWDFLCYSAAVTRVQIIYWSLVFYILTKHYIVFLVCKSHNANIIRPNKSGFWW